ncbi:MAG: copper amine oxidase N-terminal domain-containing protein [Firmicutes bacterium]|nr:copper amine oxidase N-terminal domain-containing protein [Bacillota bacterium]
MKKIISLTLIAALILSATFTCFGVNIKIDDEYVQFTEDSGEPFIDSANRTQVPLRVTMEAYGCNVDWNGDTRTAIVEKDGRVVQVPIGQNYILINGDKKYNDTAAVIKNDRTYLPIRAVLEAFGAEVDWDQTTETVLVKRDSNSGSDEGSEYPYKIVSVEGKDSYKGIDIGDCHYEKVVFTNPNASLAKINQVFDETCTSFLETEGDSFYQYGVMDIDADRGYFPYYCTSDVDKVYTSDEYISIKTLTHWYCGGVSNSNCYGFTFNTDTGEYANISDFFGGNEAKAEQIIKNECISYVNNSQNYFFEDAVETINSYDLEDFVYYYDSDLYIIFNIYEIGPGSSGTHIIKIDL